MCPAQLDNGNSSRTVTWFNLYRCCRATIHWQCCPCRNVYLLNSDPSVPFPSGCNHTRGHMAFQDVPQHSLHCEILTSTACESISRHNIKLHLLAVLLFDVREACRAITFSHFSPPSAQTTPQWMVEQLFGSVQKYRLLGFGWGFVPYTVDIWKRHRRSWGWACANMLNNSSFD